MREIRATREYPLSGIRVTESYIAETCPLCGIGTILTVLPPEREQIKMPPVNTVKPRWPIAITLAIAGSALTWLIYQAAVSWR